LRLGLSLAGVPDSITTFCSITGVILLAVLYFGLTSSGWKEMFMASYAVILAYTLVAAIALGYTAITGDPTVFQRHVGREASWHLVSMVGGGLSFEPLAIFGLMWVIAWIRTSIRRRPQRAASGTPA
jgi:hypothetical protein